MNWQTVQNNSEDTQKTKENTDNQHYKIRKQNTNKMRSLTSRKYKKIKQKFKAEKYNY